MYMWGNIYTCNIYEKKFRARVLKMSRQLVDIGRYIFFTKQRYISLRLFQFITERSHVSNSSVFSKNGLISIKENYVVYNTRLIIGNIFTKKKSWLWKFHRLLSSTS